MRLTKDDYERAIADLGHAATQLEPDGRDCAVCGDSDHHAWECHHNPLVIARRYERLESTAADQLHKVMGV